MAKAKIKLASTVKANSVKPARKAPSTDTMRRLFALSGNQCARPGCNTVLLNATGKLVGEAAHIAAHSGGGPRYDKSMSPDERRAFENLILLCATCHTLVDKDPQTYTRAKLVKWKADREKRFSAVGELLRKAYLDEITDESDETGVSLPETLAGYDAYLSAISTTPSLDAGAPAAVAAYAEKLRHLTVKDRQLIVAIVEKALQLTGAREHPNGVSVNPDDLRTLRINEAPLTQSRIKRLGETLDRNQLGEIDVDDGVAQLFIKTIDDDFEWSSLKAYMETKGGTLSDLLVGMKFAVLD